MVSVPATVISMEAARKPSALAFVRSAYEILDAVQPRAYFLVECFAIELQ
jgi:hypothetical protein